MAIELGKLPFGKNLMKLEVYIDNLMPYSYPEDECKINYSGAVTSEDDDDLCTIEFDDHFALLPGPEFNPRLYRGQTQFYEVCRPSLYRESNQLSLFVNILKNFEFYKFLFSEHPIIHDLTQWTLEGKHYHIDAEGLAQHYELPTTMIDITRSKDVALFFAHCLKNDSTGNYEPILNMNHSSVLYTIDFRSLVQYNRNYFNPIGFQGLPRPEAQKACSIPLSSSDNLNNIPHVYHTIFKINPRESKRLFEKFEGGTTLFPPDPAAEIANKIKESKVIDEDVLENVIKYNYIPKNFDTASDAKKFLNGHGYTVEAKNIVFSPDVKKKIIENWLATLPLLSQRLKWRLTSQPYEAEE